jgi:hypothetical protein
MVETLKGEGPFTVFAPIDEAFGQLHPGVLDWLLAEEGRKALEAVTQSHITPGAALLAGDLLDQAVEVATLGGGAFGTAWTMPWSPARVPIRSECCGRRWMPRSRKSGGGTGGPLAVARRPVVVIVGD